MRVKSIFWILGAMAFVVLAAAGAWYWVIHGSIETTDNAYLRADSVVIAPRITGYIERVAVSENQEVSKGTLLVTLDSREYDSRVKQAAATRDSRLAQIEGGRAAVERLKSQTTLQRIVIERSEAGRAGAIAGADRARRDFERYKNLTATKTSSVERLDQAISDHLKASAEVRRAASTVSIERKRLSTLSNDIAEAMALLKQWEAELVYADAELALAQIDFSSARLTAPFNGVIGNVSARVGQYVRPGSALLTVVPKNPYVIANFKETQISRMKPGQHATMSIDALPGSQLFGKVVSFAPATGAEFSVLPPQNATGNFTKIVQRVPVRIAVEQGLENLGRISSGLSVVVSVDTSTESCHEQDQDRCSGAQGPHCCQLRSLAKPSQPP